MPHEPRHELADDATLDELVDRLRPHREGKVAHYIPELACASPELFGIALCNSDGMLRTAGDALTPFSVQSISKPFVYALALLDLGLERVLACVGAEPSGEAFNAISLEPKTGRPANPMINAGAIVTTALVKARDAEERFVRILQALSDFAGRALDMDEAVYRSELETGDRNRALAYLMRSAGSLTEVPVQEALDVYFRQCAVRVAAVDVAVMATTLALGGINPLTHKRVVAPRVAEHVLAIMATCGMYDYSGEWLLRVGLPAKSGVSGGLLIANPGHFGAGLFSPPLDLRGNSVRAVLASQELADRFPVHMMSSAP